MLCLSSLGSRADCHSKVVVRVMEKMLDWQAILPESHAVAYTPQFVCMILKWLNACFSGPTEPFIVCDRTVL